jgi:ankyrin repeat protein
MQACWMRAGPDTASVGDHAKVQRFESEGASVHELNEMGANAHMTAVIQLRTPVVRWLLETGGARVSDVHVDNDGNTAFAFAAAQNRYSLKPS